MHKRHLRARTSVKASIPLAVLSALMLALGRSACSRSASEPGEVRAPGPTAPGAAQTSEGGQVTVKVTWKGAQGADAGPVFAVALDTHSVDLDGIDLRTLAVLRTSDGREAQPTSWNAPKGGHHREGELTFPATATDGSPLNGATTETITLTIRDIAGVAERSFQWSPQAPK